MIEGKTSWGFEYKIADDARDDMELLEALITIDTDGVSGLMPAIVRLLGPEQKAALYDFHRNSETGRVPASEIMSEITEILTDAGTQNSGIKN